MKPIAKALIKTKSGNRASLLLYPNGAIDCTWDTPFTMTDQKQVEEVISEILGCTKTSSVVEEDDEKRQAMIEGFEGRDFTRKA